MFGANDNFADLATQISSSTAIITSYLEKNNMPQPTFAVDSPRSLPEVPEVQAARMALIEAATKIHHLAVGADDYIWHQSLILKHDQSVLDILNQYNVWDAVPFEGTTTYAAISAKTGLAEHALRRVMRHAMTTGIFTETAPGSGRIMHTATSSVPARFGAQKAMIAHNLEEVAAGSIYQAEALRKYADSQEPGEVATQLAFKGNWPAGKTYFEWAGESEREGEAKGWRVRRFGQAMASMANSGPARIEHINAGFDWDSLGEATVVDIGGSVGHASIELATKHPNLHLIVQDFAELEPQHNSIVPSSIRSRVSFQAHNFFTPQPVANADVYLLKHILHDWPDKYALKILRNIVPALKPGARVIVMDGVLPPQGAVPLNVERLLTGLDLQMLAICNSKERMAGDWIKLFEEADSKFEFKGIVQPPGSAAALIEVVWKGDV